MALSRTDKPTSSDALLPPPPAAARSGQHPPPYDLHPPPAPPPPQSSFLGHFLTRHDSAAPLLPHQQQVYSPVSRGDGEAEDGSAESDQQAAAVVRRELPPIRYLRAWTYPLKGIYYLLRHPPLWAPIRRRLPLALLLSALIIAFLFLFTFLPQAALIKLFHLGGPVAYLHAALSVLVQSATVISFVLETFVIEEGLTDIFDATLLIKREEELVARGREVQPMATHENGRLTESGARTVVDRLGELTQNASPPFSCWDICVWIIELPVNFIPLLGPWLFLALQGMAAGPNAHYHYTKLVGLRKKERELYFRERRLEYTGFGTIGLLLQTFPIASTFVCFTNAIGAALWAAQVERVKRGEGLDRRIETHDTGVSPVAA